MLLLWRLFRCGLSTAASQPLWAMIGYTKIRASSAQRASIELAQPPVVSHLVVPEPEPPLYSDSDIIVTVVGHAGATTGDGLLLLDFMDICGTARVVATHRAGAQQRKLTAHAAALGNAGSPASTSNPDITRFVCNAISGQLFRLPDVDGTKKTMYCHHIGLLTRSTHGQAPPDKFAVAALSEDLDGKEPALQPHPRLWNPQERHLHEYLDLDEGNPC
ncbi:hypothetical protein E2562_014893 [Oryza meyeriana var. granulata]|uniref:Uncharacterized protein n=1 Tax=Oryza meyeriana var. granulata TaxID=110450 RepID=A0A6G1EJL4_9ORYZ|nr:hypothetical protein E2562_014893 [Oryza meyeriana var. granulata]